VTATTAPGGEGGQGGDAPLEFNPFADAFFDNPYETYRRMRDEAPVYHSDRWDFYALSRCADVVAAHRDWETFSSAYGVTVDLLAMRQKMHTNMMIIMDPPDHDRLRKLVRTVFTRRAIDGLEPLVTKVITGFLDQLAGRDSFDMVADFAALFPVEIISTILGIPEGERQQVRLWTDGFLHREPDNPNVTHDGVMASLTMHEYMLELARHKRRSPDDLIISRLVDTTVEDDDGTVHRLSDDDIASFAVLLAAAGSETVTKLMGNGVVAVDQNPGQWQLILEDAKRIPGAVEEMLRLQPPSQYQGRFTTRDVTLHGVTIPAGSPTLLITGAATRDPREYDRPDVFDITRNASTTVVFGYGVHSCLGTWLARLEGRVAFEQIRAHWPSFTVESEGLRRVTMSNVAGYSHVPVRITR
jgi:cytochrome P450